MIRKDNLFLFINIEVFIIIRFNINLTNYLSNEEGNSNFKILSIIIEYL